ncbi:hypothetical protein TBLA_0G03090 [Henningerozyma blattae CBS 6284]|uniref:IMS import disulfide relay-system CHCH-CHCH-like Cx9C domain-containing protein n=1 Tax=Henningerozyma blattae (strain ATCC 34711 / CBS 6284 / DSM 70876 / NBRC 10599 / NRRL Y-10934 / UCD 77-7) TaxID=1071380 RepID=I2H794_HENB6|nr:hypothetical protein TBLA_0G03090 [Tetrapisispora blattae CBS 6284]CCH62246.1 hypothetical protein TBLA_0G03090 [Tetrapisispora blattae CBS 6284]
MSSNVLDEIVMEEVALNCPQQFITYHKCLSSNEDCNASRKELSNCIENKVPSIQKIMTNCQTLLNNYNNCIRKNWEKGESDTSIDQLCSKELDSLRECSSNQLKGTKPILSNLKFPPAN